MISAVNAPKRKVIAFTLPASNDTSSSEDSLVFEDFLPEDPQGRRLVQMIAVGKSSFLAQYRNQASLGLFSRVYISIIDWDGCRDWTTFT